MRIALIVLLICAGADRAAAQQSSSTRLAGALGLGMTWLPEPLVETCGSGGTVFPAVEARASVQRSGWTVAARATAFGRLGFEDCLTISPAHESGTHTDRIYPYDRGHGGSALSLHVQHAPGSGPLTLGAGAGWLSSDDVPFALISVGARTRGAAAAFVALEAWAMRLRHDRVTAEWHWFSIVEESERTRHSAWHRSLSLRFGIHFAPL